MKIIINSSGKQKNSFDVAIAASCLCALVQLYAQPHGNSAMVSLSVRFLQLIWIIAGGKVLLLRLSMPFPKKMISALMVFGITLLAYMVSMLRGMTSLWDSLVQTLGFLSLPLMLFYGLFRNMERTKRIIILFHICASIIYISLYHSDLRHIYETAYGITNLKEVTLGYANPNQTSMYLLVCVIVLTAGVFFFSSKIAKILTAVDAVYISWILFQTESRAAIIVLIVFAASLLAYKRTITKIWIEILFLIPVAYVCLSFWGAKVIQLTFLNEQIYNGREGIYAAYFEQLNLILLAIGDMETFAFENLHNGYLAIAASVGVFACWFYVQFLRSCVSWNLPDRDSPRFESVGFMGFLCIILHTSAEAAFFVGGVQYAFLVFSIYVLFAKPYIYQRIQGDDGVR